MTLNRNRALLFAVLSTVVLLVVIVLVALAGNSEDNRAGGQIPASVAVSSAPGSSPNASPSSKQPTAAPSPSVSSGNQSTDPLARLAVQEPVFSPAYVREAFGDPWEDVNNNGCDTRNDILNRDLTDITWRSDDVGCTVQTGTLRDPYTGMTINFVRGRSTSIKVQIDHIIPLAYAWRQGAWAWSEQQRLAFANDPDNLIAVDGPTNGSKSDSGPAEWLPPNTSYYCQYLDDFVEVLIEYQLSVSPADYRLLRQASSSCQLG